MAKLIDNSIPKFLLVGVGNTLLSMVLMFLMEGLGYWPSTAIAYVAGAVMSFFLNRHFTFHSEETFWRSAVKFAINVAVCYGIAYALAQPIAGWVLGNTGMDPIWQERLTKLTRDLVLHHPQLFRPAVLCLPEKEALNLCEIPRRSLASAGKWG